MGLKIHSLAELPTDVGHRGYYLYLLDYGCEEPIGRALRDNFDKMADAASRNDAAGIRPFMHRPQHRKTTNR